MKNIVFTRIDDRLIHGQVMTAWLSNTNANEIVIIDDEVAQDDFIKMVMLAAVPQGIHVEILTVDEAVEYLSGEDAGAKIIILVKNPFTINELLQKGVTIKELNVGGMGLRGNRSQVYRNIAASDDERDVFKKMITQKIVINIQVIPSDSKIDISKYL